MANLLLLALTLVAVCRAEFSVTEYADSKKQVISSWHQLFTSPALDGERLTTIQANGAAQDMALRMETSLTASVTYLRGELEVAMEMMASTPGEGCVSGIAAHMDNAVVQAVNDYNDCSADIQSILSRRYYTLTKEIKSCEDIFQRSMSGIDNCAKRYPNVGSQSRLMMCVDSWVGQYFRVANQSMYNTSNSPAMAQFQSLVVEGADAARRAVVSEGWAFVNMMMKCYILSGNPDYDSYSSQLALGYSLSLSEINLKNQVVQAQRELTEKGSELQGKLLQFYDFLRSAVANYELTSRNQTYYGRQLSESMSSYWTTVKSSSSDNPAQARCGAIAEQELTTITTAGSQEAVECYQSVVNQTRRVLGDVKDVMLNLVLVWPSYSNPSLLSCLREGFIYGNNIIYRCFSLDLSEFDNKVSETYENIVKNMDVLKENVGLLSNTTVIPCGKSIMRKVQLACDRSLYNYQRCLYQESGTNYEVTTSHSYTTSPGYDSTYVS